MVKLEKGTTHSRMSDPAGHAVAIAGLPSDIGVLSSIIQGVLIHADWLTAYGVDDSHLLAASRTTLPVADRLDSIFEKDAQRLQIRRSPRNRAVGTCRDFALMLCSFLRSKGIPSRVRCGFANYFNNRWEDHWVCEYWDQQAQTWCLSDLQIDGLLKDRCRIEFDPKDVPRYAFVTAGQAWLAFRGSWSDPNRFGHGEITGSWFIKVNVLRDHYAVNGHETSAWDGWRAAALPKRVVDQHIALLDDLAARPQQQLVEMVPDWLE